MCYVLVHTLRDRGECPLRTIGGQLYHMYVVSRAAALVCRTPRSSFHCHTHSTGKVLLHGPQQSKLISLSSQNYLNSWWFLNMYLDLDKILKIGGIESNPGPKDDSKIAHVNINSITSENRRDELEEFTSSNKIQILALTETKLDSTIHESQFKLKHFQQPFVRHRNRRGGGVAIYFHTSLAASRLPDLEIGNEEWIWAKVKFSTMTIILCCVYIPPDLRAERLQEFLDHFHESISMAQIYNPASIIVTGDFNAGNTYLSSNFNHSPVSAFERQLEITAESLGLSQLITEPTRHQDATQNLRDLCFVSNPEIVTASGVLPSFSNLDHFPIHVSVKATIPDTPLQEKQVWDYSRLDVENLTHKLLHTNWDSIINNEIDTATALFTSTLIEAAKDTIPIKTIFSCNNKPWMTNELKRLMRKRDRLFKHAQSRQAKRESDNDVDWSRWRQCRNKVNTMVRKLKAQCFHRGAKLLLEEKHNPQKYHSIVRRMTGKSKDSSIPPLISPEGVLIENDTEKSEALNTFFAKQSDLLNDEDKDIRTSPNEQIPKLEIPVITEFEVLNTINGLSPNKATGPDELPTKIIKLTALLIARPLARLFNNSLQQGVFPSSWKIANVKPIFKKKGSPAEISSYRPISLLCCLSKVFEKIMFKRIYQHLTDHDLLTERQSGYRPGHGTRLQLFYLTHTMYETLDKGRDLTVLYLDISRYFEKIWHKGLLHKCGHEFGLDNILPWLRSYLTNRRQRVLIRNSSSALLPLKAGCPQGSVLGPLLALLYLNGLSNKTTNEILFFADDTCLFAQHDRGNETDVRNSLQNDLNEILAYGHDWLITFNASKTIQQTFSYRQDKIAPNLIFDSKPIPVVEKHKHLGIIFSKDLRFHEQINEITRKVNIALSPLYPIAPYLPREILEKLFQTYVRPHFDYCDVIFDGLITTNDAQRLERLQNRAARLMTGALPRTATTKLRTDLGWTTLKIRREIHKIQFFHSLSLGLLPNYIQSILPNLRQNAMNRDLRNAYQRTEITFRTTNFKNSFLPCTTKLFNRLPEQIRMTGSHQAFKKQVEEQLGCRKPTKYYTYGAKIPNSLLMQLRVGMSKLNGHAYQVQKSPSPSCICGHNNEDTKHYFLHCPRYENIRNLLAQNITQIIGTDFMALNSITKLDILLHGHSLSDMEGHAVARQTIKFIMSSKRFRPSQHSLT